MSDEVAVKLGRGHQVAIILADRLGAYFRCAICGGRVEDLELAYRCEAEGVRWEKTETRLLLRDNGAKGVRHLKRLRGTDGRWRSEK